MKIEIDKDGITLESEDVIDNAFLDYWTRGKEVHLPEYSIEENLMGKRNRKSSLRIEFRKYQTATKSP